jgi:hypothetical protein
VKKILKAAKEKRQVTYKGKPIRITAEFSTQSKHKKIMERHNLGPKRK